LLLLCAWEFFGPIFVVTYALRLLASRRASEDWAPEPADAT
jgi:hypothetical protein